MKPGLRTGKPMRSANREHFKPNQVLAGGCMRGFAPNPCDDLSASGSATVDRTTPQFERSRPCLTSALTGHFLPLPRNLHLPVPIPRTMTDPSLLCGAATRRDIVAIPIPPPACVEESFTPATPCRHTRETCSDNMQPSPPRINRTSWPASPISICTVPLRWEILSRFLAHLIQAAPLSLSHIQLRCCQHATVIIPSSA